MNSFGRIFRVSIFGESHGLACGILIDGVPPGISVCQDDFISDLERRKSGAKGTTPRREADLPELESGLFCGKTTGAPVLIRFINANTRSGDYDEKAWRPGHADFVASKKYKGYADFRGGGHFSGRLTLGLVAAGVLAKKILNGICIRSKLLEVGGVLDYGDKLDAAIAQGDSLGGIIECYADGIPVGLGEPFFDSVESVLAHLVFSIPGVRGIEFGQGFESARVFGSEHNDCLCDSQGKTKTNHAGGINGGITNGNPLVFRVAIKPTASIHKKQQSYHQGQKDIHSLVIQGRHDAAFVLRVPVILEAALALVLADFFLTNSSKL